MGVSAFRAEHVHLADFPELVCLPENVAALATQLSLNFHFLCFFSLILVFFSFSLFLPFNNLSFNILKSHNYHVENSIEPYNSQVLLYYAPFVS